MREPDEHMFEEVAFSGAGRGDSPATPTLGSVGAGRESFDVSGVGDRDHHVLFSDERFLVKVAQFLAGNLGSPGVGVFLLQLAEVRADEVVNQVLVGQNRLISGDVFAELLVFISKLVRFQAGELLQPHRQDGVGLVSGERAGRLGVGIVQGPSKDSGRRPPAPSTGLGLRSGSPRPG